ncbi:MAG: hypothetical protein EOP68_23915, partial [Sphingomonas sp.]
DKRHCLRHWLRIENGEP